jgi:large subunit ribosomal protein L18
VIDDKSGRTLVAASSMESDMPKGPKIEVAKAVGLRIAEKSKAAGIESVVFDRSGYLYHGRIQSLAEGAREGGLQF